LQSANEEILSSNEELQSTNEELDTAKEELQSTNEELNTVNEELHSRNDELARVNSDLVNLLGSVDLPIVIVGEDLAIRRFTPAAERLFNLISGDVGRPIGQINPNIVCDNLEGLIRTTIEGIDPQEQQVHDRDGRWYSLRIRPYKGVDNRLDGAVVTAITTEDTRRYQRQVERLREYFMKVVETVSQPMLVLDEELRVRTANKAFYDTFSFSRKKTE
jgi:two-component system CheB/CheR fusion protein